MNVTDTLKGANATQLADHLKLPILNFHESSESVSSTQGQSFTGQFVSEDQPSTFAFRLINREAAGQSIGTERSQYLHVRYVNSRNADEILPTTGNVTEMVRQVATFLKGQLVAGGSNLTIDQADVRKLNNGMEDNARITIPSESWEQGLLATQRNVENYTIHMPEATLRQPETTSLRQTG